VVVGPLDRDGGEDREHRLAAILDELGVMPLAAGNARPAIPAPVGVQQVLQHAAADLVHGGPDGQLGGLQVEVAEAGGILEEPAD